MRVYTQYIICIWDYSRLTLGKEIGLPSQGTGIQGIGRHQPPVKIQAPSIAKTMEILKQNWEIKAMSQRGISKNNSTRCGFVSN